MKLVQIGTLGHYAYAIPTAQKYGLDYVGICGADEEDDLDMLSEKLTRAGFFPRRYEDWRTMIEAEKPDIAIVNSVMGRNAEIAAFALEHGVSVFCEKPVATEISALTALEETYHVAKEKYADRHLAFCGMFGIDYLPHFETALRYLESGALGEVRLVNAQKSYRMGHREKFYSDREKYGGTIPWVAIHGIEWVMRLAGFAPVSVTACASTACNAGNGTMEASTLCLFACEDGKMASVSADVMRPATAPTHDDDRLRVVGSDGVLEVRGGRVFVIDRAGERELPLAPSETELFEEFLLEIEGKAKCRVSAEITFAVTRAALAARLSADTGKTIWISEVR